MPEFITQMPKTELHLHLEGAIPLTALWELIQKYDSKSEISGIEELERRFQYQDFPHFIDTWVWKNGFLREYEDFSFIASEVAQDLASQNIRYVEAFYSPGDFARHGLQPQELTQAIRQGLSKHSADITVNLVADLVRDFGPEQGMIWLEQLAEVQDQGIIGIGIGGSEHSFPPEPYQEVYERARGLGFKTSAHAGEAAGPESVRGALDALRVDRIGHGARAVEDPALVTRLKESQTPLEMCPISNLKTGVVSSIAEHPIRRFYDQGLLVTVNTDDPKMFNNTLVDEYEVLMSELEFSQDDIVQLASNSIQAAWCSDERKQALQDELHVFVAQPS